MKFQPTTLDKQKYVLEDPKDLVILEKIKSLEIKKLQKEDKVILKLIKTQLERNWREPLIVYLNKLIKKYERE